MFIEYSTVPNSFPKSFEVNKKFLRDVKFLEILICLNKLKNIKQEQSCWVPPCYCRDEAKVGDRRCMLLVRWCCSFAENSTFYRSIPFPSFLELHAVSPLAYEDVRSIEPLCSEGPGAGGPAFPSLISLLPIVFVVVFLVPFWQHYTRMLKHGVDGACSAVAKAIRT